MLEAHFRTWHERIAATLVYFREQGAARADLDTDVTAELVLGMVERLARRYLFQDRRPDIASLVDALVALELRGIAGR
jgi:hypothetical protein